MTNLPATIDHGARAHSTIGGSVAERLMECTASLKHNEPYPNTESDFAAEGTACHEAIDFILQGRTQKDTDVIGLVFHDRVITEKLFTTAIAPALEMFDALDQGLGGLDFYNERRVVFPGIPGAFGTCDIVGAAEDGSRTIVLDWKFGSGVAVSAENNKQLQYYAYAAMHTAPTDRLFSKDRPIDLVIVQPRASEGAPFTTWTTSVAQLEVFAYEFKKKIDEALSGAGEFVMGKWCKFCPGKTGCPVRRGQVKGVLELTPDQIAASIADLLPEADNLIEMGRAIKNAAHKAMEQGAQIPGYKLVKNRATRKWKDEDATLKALAGLGLKGDAAYSPRELLSPKGAEDALKKLGHKLPEDLYEKISSGTTLAPEDDPRPAVSQLGSGLKRLAQRLKAG